MTLKYRTQIKTYANTEIVLMSEDTETPRISLLNNWFESETDHYTARRLRQSCHPLSVEIEIKRQLNKLLEFRLYDARSLKRNIMSDGVLHDERQESAVKKLIVEFST